MSCTLKKFLQAAKGCMHLPLNKQGTAKCLTDPVDLQKGCCAAAALLPVKVLPPCVAGGQHGTVRHPLQVPQFTCGMVQDSMKRQGNCCGSVSAPLSVNLAPPGRGGSAP
jgi:hypothetical protein